MALAVKAIKINLNKRMGMAVLVAVEVIRVITHTPPGATAKMALLSSHILVKAVNV